MNNKKQSRCQENTNDLEDVSGAEYVLLKFCSGTTAHGFSYLTKTSIICKIFWIFIRYRSRFVVFQYESLLIVKLEVFNDFK